MTSLDRAFRPELPEGRATHIKEGFVMGWLPAEIVSLDDPERNGRVQVRCDLVQPNTVWPNANDGWCWVLEDYTLPTRVGGSHKMLKVGSQVAIVPMQGDPRQMLVIGCIHCRRDSPSPHTDRFNESYGSVSANGVIDIADDRQLSRGTSYPHGVFQHVSGDGNLTYQTRDNARLQLQQDGNCRIENDTCFSALSPDGLVQQGNESGAFSRLDPSGEISHQSPSGTGISLGAAEVMAKGPASGISKLVRDARKTFGGRLGDCLRTVRDLNDALSLLSSSDFINKTPRIVELIDRVSSLSDFLDEGQEIVSKISSSSPEDLAKAIAPQVDICLGLNLEKLLPEIEDVVISEDGGSIAEQIEEILPDELKERIRPELIDRIAKIFSYDKKMAAKAILHEVLPLGANAISNMFGLNLQKTLGTISDAIETIRDVQSLLQTPGISPVNVNAFVGQLVSQTEVLGGLFPESISKYLSGGTLESVLGIPEASDISPLHLAIGHISSGIAADTQSSIAKIGPALDRLGAVREIFRQKELYETGVTSELLDRFKGIAADRGLDWSGVEYSDISQYLSAIATPILREIEAPLSESVGQFNRLIESIPDDLPAVTFSLGEKAGKLSAKGLGLGGSMEIGPDGGQIVGPDNTTKLAIANGSAKIRSALGGYGLDKKGLKAAVDVLDFMEVGIDKFQLTAGMKKGFRVKISPFGISIGLNGIPSLPDLSRLAKELIGSEEIAKTTETFDRIKQAVEGAGGGDEDGGSSGGGSGSGSGGLGNVSLDLNEKGISAGSKNGPSIDVLGDRIGVAGVDHLPFVTHTHEILNYTVETLDLMIDFAISLHFPWETEEYGSNWQTYVRENMSRPEEVIEYLAPLHGQAGFLMAALIYRRMDRPLHDWEEFGFEADDDGGSESPE